LAGHSLLESKENNQKTSRARKPGRGVTPHPLSGGASTDALHLTRVVGNRVASQVYTARTGQGGHASQGISSLVQRSPNGNGAQKKLTPAELVEKLLKRGPGKQKRDWQRSTRKLEGSKSLSQRINIDAQSKYLGLKLVNGDQYRKEFEKAGNARPEAGLPEAFLDVDTSITPPEAATASARTIDTNVLLDTRAKSDGGEIWVTEANLTWIVQTAAFLNISEIDPAMLSPTERHEKGHQEISERTQADLAQRLKSELDQDLPSAQQTLKISGKGWAQKGVNEIIRMIEKAIARYLAWWNEMTQKADAAWDAQEKKTLSRIAAARVKTHQAAVPQVPSDK
jgi:hypothetical protein